MGAAPRRALPAQHGATPSRAEGSAVTAVLPEVERLYRANPGLRALEHEFDPRLEARRGILDLIEPASVGAELGVLTGLFSELIVDVARPSVLHLVDAWWLVAEHFPPHRALAKHGPLSTRAAHAIAAARAESLRDRCDVRLHVARSTDWLRSLPDGALDWAYLDTTHTYRDTLEELRLLARKVRPGGLVLGDDWYPDPAHRHHGVFRAVHDAVRAGVWDVVRADEHAQWALRHAVRYRRGERYRGAVARRARRLLRRADTA